MVRFKRYSSFHCAAFNFRNLKSLAETKELDYTGRNHVLQDQQFSKSSLAKERRSFQSGIVNSSPGVNPNYRRDVMPVEGEERKKDDGIWMTRIGGQRMAAPSWHMVAARHPSMPGCVCSLADKTRT